MSAIRVAAAAAKSNQHCIRALSVSVKSRNVMLHAHPTADAAAGATFLKLIPAQLTIPIYRFRIWTGTSIITGPGGYCSSLTPMRLPSPWFLQFLILHDFLPKLFYGNWPKFTLPYRKPPHTLLVPGLLPSYPVFPHPLS